MINSKLLDNKNEKNSLICFENLYKGACVKIKNSDKTFQVIGLNLGKEICWVREWPFACLLYTSPSPRDKRQYRMPSSA